MQTIEIKTTQNVVIDYELATLRERLIAYFLDLAIFFAVYYFLLILTLFASFGAGGGEWIMLFLGFLSIAAWVFYHLLMETFNGGQTIGKKIMSIQVVRVDGKEPSFFDHLLRSVFMLPDIMFSAGVVASVLIASSEKRQRFGDMAAGTTVVRRKVRSKFLLEDILKIQSLDDYELTYPEVRHLSEEDMLLVKEVINRYEAYGDGAPTDKDVYKEIVENLIVKLTPILKLKKRPQKPILFLKTLIRDYIVLTR